MFWVEKLGNSFGKKASFKLGVGGMGMLWRARDRAKWRRLMPHRKESSVVPRGSRQLSWLSGCVITNPEAAPSHRC